MKSRKQRNAQFEAIKASIFEAGVAAVAAANAHEQFATTAVQALAEAYGVEPQDAAKALPGG